MPIYKRVEELTPEDFAAHPVWEFAPEMEGVDGFDWTVVKPVAIAPPVGTLDKRVVGTSVTLANGIRVPAMFGTVDFEKVLRDRKLLGLSLFWNGQWRGFFPPHDFDRPGSQAIALAKALGLAVEDVFPISYDLGEFCTGGPAAIRGEIQSGIEAEDTDIVFVDGINAARTYAGVFAAEEHVGWFYLYKILDPDRLNEDGNLEIVNVAHVLNGPPDFSDSDVEVRWFDRDTKVGVLIGNILWAYFDVEAGRSVSGRYPSRPLPWPELTPEH